MLSLNFFRSGLAWRLVNCTFDSSPKSLQSAGGCTSHLCAPFVKSAKICQRDCTTSSPGKHQYHIESEDLTTEATRAYSQENFERCLLASTFGPLDKYIRILSIYTHIPRCCFAALETKQGHNCKPACNAHSNATLNCSCLQVSWEVGQRCFLSGEHFLKLGQVNLSNARLNRPPACPHLRKYMESNLYSMLFFTLVRPETEQCKVAGQQLPAA